MSQVDFRHQHMSIFNLGLETKLPALQSARGALFKSFDRMSAGQHSNISRHHLPCRVPLERPIIVYMQ